jgi:hypothetical protein
MHRKPGRFTIYVSSAVITLATLAGCSRSDKKATPVAQTKTDQAAEPARQPVTLSGCVRAGESSDTFVLTTSATTDGTAPATYQLASASGGVDFRDQIGKRVEVSGVVRSQQHSEIHATGPAANKPTGTSGTPNVDTTTELDINHLDVSSLKPLADRCDK